MIDQVVRDFILNEELETSVQLVCHGLHELQRIDGSHDFYHLPMMLLSNGMERFMKVILLFHEYEKAGKYPTQFPGEKARKGHDLAYLLDEIKATCFSSYYQKHIPVASEDIHYLRTDTRLNEFVKILSDFGMASRYYNIDVVIGKSPITDSPKQEWSKLENALIAEHPEWNIDIGKTPIDIIYQHINAEIVTKCERLMRALSRLFTLGEIGANARRFSGAVYPFLMLRDVDLGTKKY